MKKLVIITAIAALTTASAFGQGTIRGGSIVFANSSTKPVTLVDGTVVPKNSTYRAELFWAPDGGGNDVQATFNQNKSKETVDATFAGPPVGASTGVFSGGTRTISGISPDGAFAYFQVRVFDSAYGATYDAVVANPLAQGVAQVGTSQIFRSDTDDPNDTSPAVPLATAFIPFQLSIVPEPSVIGLGLLGAGALLMLRRRK